MGTEEPEEELSEPSYVRLQPSEFTGIWTVEGGALPVWVDKEEPPPLIESNKHDPFPSVLERLGLRLKPDEE